MVAIQFGYQAFLAQYKILHTGISTGLEIDCYWIFEVDIDT